MQKRNQFLFYYIPIAVLLTLACGLPSLHQDIPSAPPTLRSIDQTSVSTSPESSPQPSANTQQSGPSSSQIEGRRSWPDTWSGIHVFNDQLASWSMTDEQWQFAAQNYVGTQKMTRADADRLRSINPAFIILHYRLGIGLGNRIISQDCQPDGEWISIIEGEDWVQEWPGDGNVDEGWFYHWPEGSISRVLNCDWGWYLAELDDSGWRNYWHDEILRQVQANDDDGVFMDSLSVPNFLGFDSYVPNLPEVDSDFETAWSGRIQHWLAWLQSQPLGAYFLIPNVGNWITSRHITDYTDADGVMIEGFALEADASPYNLEDWQMQMDRTLGLIQQDKIIITQTTAPGDQERMFTLGSYLLVKDHHTYLNLELDLEPDWWPEYDIPIGTPLENTSIAISDLYDAEHHLYRRLYDNGLVLVNPTSPWDGSALDVTFDLDGTYFLAQTSGGGNLSPEGIPGGSLTYQPVNRVILPPYSAAVLLNQHP